VATTADTGTHYVDIGQLPKVPFTHVGFGYRGYYVFWCCQTNANQSLLGQKGCPSRRAEATPLRKSRGAVEFEFVATVEMAFLVEMVVN
jgi:hypothetical protein